MSHLAAAPPDPVAAPPRRRRWSAVLGVVSGIVLVAVAATALTWTDARSQWIRDRWVVWTQPSPAAVAELADATGMSEEGRTVYLASTPEIESGADFEEDCAIESGIVLGCYVRGEIFLFEVTDERLAGTTEVTAAHEMLHAAYDRLTPEERRSVDTLVAQAVAAIPAGDPVFAELDLYDQAQRPDEWHSRLGTQFADLPAELEAYYGRWFADRTLVLDLAERSRALLVELEAEIAGRVAELDALGADLEARSAAYDAAVAALDADVDDFNARARSGDFASQAEFDAERADLVARSAQLEAEVAAINADIERYNALRADLAALDADYADLYESLDATPGPPDIDD